MPTRKLHVLIHGFVGDRNASPNLQVRPALLRDYNVDVLSVDFANLVVDPCYREAVHNSHFVGRCLAHLLVRSGANISDTHLIGFGLGAHVAGFAAKMLAALNIQVKRITALDPAKPLFLTNRIEDRLDKGDAGFVDVIHSDVFLHGLMSPIGHVDFFPNKGVMQPDCGPISQC